MCMCVCVFVCVCVCVFALHQTEQGGGIMDVEERRMHKGDNYLQNLLPEDLKGRESFGKVSIGC